MIISFAKSAAGILLFILYSTFFCSGQYPSVCKIQEGLLDTLELHPERSYMVIFNDQLQHSSLDLHGLSKNEKADRILKALKNKQSKVQENVVRFLQKNNCEFQSFYIVNAIKVNGNAVVIPELAKFENVSAIIADPFIRLERVNAADPILLRDPGVPEWGLQMIGADKVWEMDIRGEGVVIAGQDTGYDWDQPTLKDKYRGFDGMITDHNYNWHDAIHALNPLNGDTINDPWLNPCGLNSLIPCDDHGHGTHTMGTMVGEDEENKIGVAPEAKWMACRNMDRGYGSPSTYLECFEFFLAPTDLTGENPDVSKAPHVINNSWSCPEMEGCNAENWQILETAIENLRASGVVVVASAGNSGNWGCGSVNAPPAMFEGSFTVGATAPNDSIAGFSSRGLVAADNSFLMKPNVAAPGVQVRSVLPDSSFAAWNGTSMAGPHVAGAVALIISANPYLEGKVDIIEEILEHTAVPKTTDEVCFEVPGESIPNPVYGYGRIDVLAAVQMALTISQTEEIGLPGFELFPNPASSEITLHIENLIGNVELIMHDLSGKVVFKKMLNLKQSEELKSINISHFSSGLYFCTLVSGKEFISRKLVRI